MTTCPICGRPRDEGYIKYRCCIPGKLDCWRHAADVRAKRILELEAEVAAETDRAEENTLGFGLVVRYWRDTKRRGQVQVDRLRSLCWEAESIFQGKSGDSDGWRQNWTALESDTRIDAEEDPACYSCESATLACKRSVAELRRRGVETCNDTRD